MSKPLSHAGEQDFDVAQLCRSFSELSPQPMVAVEGETHIVRYLNAAFASLSGKKRADLIGRPFAEAVPEGEANGCLGLLDRVFRSGTPEILAEQEHSQSPLECWSYSVWAILGANQHPMGVMIQVTDATEIAAFRKNSVAINEQLLVSGLHQHELTESAETATRSKDQFLATVSHELRTPLTVIAGWAGVLREETLERDVLLNGVDAILRNVQNQTLLIDDLLDVSRIVSGKLRLEMRPTDLETLIVAATDGLRPTAQSKGIALEWQNEGGTCHVMADSDRFQQVVWNLISNSLKFTPQGGRVKIQLARLESDAELTVSDTGKGIAPEFLPRVFDRFQQADSTSTRAFGGLGLGLSIVRQLTELHGGSVRVSSEGEGRGATFTVTLPLIAMPDSEIGAQSISQNEAQCGQAPVRPSEPVRLPDLKDLRVLVVDDDPDTCNWLQLILEGCGAQVKVAHSATGALELVFGEEFDVLISDIAMPEEDGYSLLTKVRAMARYSGAKVPLAAALTAFISEKNRIRALQSGFQVHMPKPISSQELIAVVADLAGRTA